MRENVQAVQEMTRGWDEARFNRPWAPGNGQDARSSPSRAHGARPRLPGADGALTPGYAAQKFDQNDWIARETIVAGPEAVAAFAAMSRLNAALFEGLSAADRAVSMSHPEFGSITVDWIIYLLAGHQIHHITQLQT